MRIHFDYLGPDYETEGHYMTFNLGDYTPSALATRGWYLTNIITDGVTVSNVDNQLYVSGIAGATEGTCDADLFYYDEADNVPTTDMLFITSNTTLMVQLTLGITASVGACVYDNVMNKLDIILDAVSGGTSNLATYAQAATIINRIG